MGTNKFECPACETRVQTEGNKYMLECPCCHKIMLPVTLDDY